MWVLMLRRSTLDGLRIQCHRRGPPEEGQPYAYLPRFRRRVDNRTFEVSERPLDDGDSIASGERVLLELGDGQTEDLPSV